MSGYLRRLATTGAAYTAASVLSKVIAVALLPLYTRYLIPADYAKAEVMFAAVVSASIVVRFGVIEALLRFYYKQDEDPEAVVRTSFAALFWVSTAAALLALPFATPISEALLVKPAPDLARIAIGSYASGGAVALVLIFIHRRRLSLRIDRPLLRRLMRFGLPTMPAELSLYLLNFVDRIIIVRAAGLTEAGLYSLAVKFAQAVNVLVRGFQLAWPPLAYSIRDDDEARRAYAAIVTWFVTGCAGVVVGMWLFSRWIARLLAAPKFFEAYEAVGLIATGVTLYALYMVLLVILGRTGRTELNFPATAAALVVNIALNLALVPPLGMVGAGIALVVSYFVVVAVMYAFTQRLFPVPYEWSRLGRILLVSAALVGIGEALLPTEGAVGFLSRLALWATFVPALLATGFFNAEERRWLAALRHPRELLAQFRAAAARPGVDGAIPEAAEMELIDEDARP